MVSEKEYYPAIESYINNQFHCISTAKNKGYRSLGLVDIIGAYDVSSAFYNDIEVVVVEVKTSISSFGKSIGQALGYSIYGERCYLAITFSNNDTFQEDHKYIANHLGVGLIRVPIDSQGVAITDQIEMILSSKKHEPILAQKHYMLNSLNISQCRMCDIYYKNESMQDITWNVERAALFTNIKNRIITLCEKSYKLIIPDEERNKKIKQKEAARKAADTFKKKRSGEEDNI